MPDKRVIIDTGNKGNLDPIVVNRVGVRVQEDETLLFKNNLKKSKGKSPTAELQFYNLGEEPSSSNPGSPIPNFCGQGGNTFEVPGAQNANEVPPWVPCPTQNYGDFAYTVAADGHETLDPVLIIEHLQSDPWLTWFNALVLGIGCLVGAGGSMAAMRMSRNASGPVDGTDH